MASSLTVSYLNCALCAPPAPEIFGWLAVLFIVSRLEVDWVPIWISPCYDMSDKPPLGNVKAIASTILSIC